MSSSSQSNNLLTPPPNWKSPLYDYSNKLILAPMVRVGVLPFRVLAREYGADIVYSEEIVDKKLLATKRVENQKLGTIDYVDANNRIVFQRCKQLDTPCVLQLGSSSPDLAVKAALHAYEDYDGLDLNCGCPKHFSVHSGMGAALLKEPEKIKQILTALIQNVPDKPITCKIRLLNTVEETVALMKMIAALGVRAIAIHARYIPQRPREPAHLNLVKPIIEELEKAKITIPIIVNGDVFTHEDIKKTRDETRCTSVMIARGALWNASIFAEKGETQWQVAKKFVDKSIQYDLAYQGVKYVLMKMFEDHCKAKIFSQLSAVKSIQDIKSIFIEDVAPADAFVSTSKKQPKRITHPDDEEEDEMRSKSKEARKE